MVNKHYVIELDGAPAGELDTVDIPELAPGSLAAGPAGGRAGPLAASYSLAEAGTLLDWIQAFARGTPTTVSGTIIAADEDRVATRRIDWTEGYITELKLPALVAKDDKPFTVAVKWQPSTVEYSKGSGTITAARTGKPRLSTASFRFQGLPGDTDYITRIDLPAITARRDRGVEVGEVKIQFSARSRDSVLGYVQKVIRDGKLTDNEYLDFSIDLLDPTGSRSLATIQLHRCGLRSSGDLLDPRRDATATFTLDFTVERFDLKLG